MAAKRPAPFTHPSRLEQVPDEPRRKRQKPNLPTNLGAQSFKKAHTVNDLKSRVRDLSRLLEHNADLPATVRVEKERALQSARYELEEEVKAKKRSDLIGRWHKVRFFDRQKGPKRLKRATRELGEVGNGEEKEVLEQRIRDAEVEVAYAVYYPLDLDYKPMFPSKRKQEGGQETAAEEAKDAVERQGDPVMWERVKQCMVDGTLDALRNGKLPPAVGGDGVAAEQRVKPATAVPAAEPKKMRKREKEGGDRHGNRRERREAARAESDNDSEGGFFE